MSVISKSSTLQEPPTTETKIGFVLRGGGVKGLALLGAVAELEKGLALKPQAFAGTSAGGLLAIALASGYSAYQLIPVLRNQHFLDFFDSGWSPDPYIEPWSDAVKPRQRFIWLFLIAGLLRLGIGCMGIPTRGGMYSSEPIGRWMLHLLRWRPRLGSLPPEPDLQTDTRLGALSWGVLTVASSTGSQNVVIHSNLGTPEFDACLAARCTMSIPAIFHPVPSGGDLLMDGGLVANFPIEQFSEAWPQARMLGVFLCDADSSAQQRDWTTSPVGLVKASLAVFLGQDELRVVKDQRQSIIWIDVTPIQTLDFDLSNEDKELLLECGRVGAIRWLRENASDSLVRPEAIPSAQEFADRAARLREMRLAARSRWRARHRHRRLALIFALVTPALLILGAMLGGGFALAHFVSAVERKSMGGGKTDRRILNVAIVRNGTAEYTVTAASAFQSTLETELYKTQYVARIEVAVGHPEANKEAENALIFRQLLSRFETKPDYLVTVGTQVSIFAKDNYLGQIPLIFVAVTDPVDAGLVKHFKPDRSRGNIGGVGYGEIAVGLRFLHTAFPGARIGFYYSSQIRQDRLVASTLAHCCREVRLIDDDLDPTRTAAMTNIDLLFGWYYLDNNFLKVREAFAGALVAGNERDMTRGAVAMMANNDPQAGVLAAKQVLLASLINGVSLADEPILRVTERRFAINKTIARQHGLTVASTLPTGTTIFE